MEQKRMLAFNWNWDFQSYQR